MPKPLLLLFFILAGFTSVVIAQERIISGTLTDESGMPLPGVNILVKGTTQGTTSDIDGRYSIQAPVGRASFSPSHPRPSMNTPTGRCL